jgi:flavodoxin I
MKKTIVVYGSSTGTCEGIANEIASKLGTEAISASKLSANIIAENENLILGTSTWGSGEIQDDWYDGLKALKGSDISDKTIAIFGCGDSSSYSDTFCGGMAEIYNTAKDGGAKVVGAVDASDYTFDGSEAVIDGQFVGLALDNDNEEYKTAERIDKWIEAIAPAL